jgi:pantetheine-phosphate adenylyltransferase
MKKGVAAVGGTFDRLHDGHRALILEAFRLGERVVVGLTSDLFVKTAGKTGVAPYKERRRSLSHFLTSSGLAERATVMKIEDRFGPTTEDQAISSIVVTKETYGTAVEANQLRVARGTKPMKIRVVDMVLAKDKLPISSSRIRGGEIDEHGNQAN